MTASSRTRSSSGASGRDALGHLLADPVAELAPAGGEDLLEQVVAADGLDRGQQPGREGVVVGREEVLRVGRDVVQVARPADAVADRLAADEVGRLERPELLEDAGPRLAPRRSASWSGELGPSSRSRSRSSRRRFDGPLVATWPTGGETAS